MPNLTSWGTHELQKLKQDMDNLFESLCSDYGIPSVCKVIDCTPNMEMVEDGENLVVKTTMPGFESEDLEVKVSETSMAISGTKKIQYRNGCQSKFFRKEIPLPCRVDPDKVEAVFKDGKLEITLYKCIIKPMKNICITCK
ncbi:Hsp20/alpha crystallin family protein [Maridesulfovibrio bastinii]|jgi:HSP20 family protein|uniref:Hsp20/alpha crystallin family protein n=1 Tax=Maridesulfovibrio bastinii TaxID=47157 RepID=UPI000412AFF9|nr:Hsp20/alpha crystallin family protein [Maridesulfovibrio bastinii]